MTEATTAETAAASAAATAEPGQTPPAVNNPANMLGDKPADPSLAGQDPGAPKAEEVGAFDAEKIKLPEGFTPDKEALKAFSDLMNDSKTAPQDRGQKLLDMYADAVKKVGEANTKAWTDLNSQWQTQVKADLGDKLDSTLQTIAKAIDTLDPAEAKAFREALVITGAGNNPAIVKAMAKFAERLVEGGHVPGNPGTGKKSLAQTFFPNSPEMQQGES